MINKKGFTLVEVIIYVAIIGVIVSSFISLSLAQTSARNKASSMSEAQANARFIWEFIDRRVKESNKINIPVSGATSSQLFFDSSLDGEEQSFVFENNNLYFQIASQARQALNNQYIKISSVEFQNISLDGQVSVHYEIDLEYNSEDSQDFEYLQKVEGSTYLRSE